MNGSSKFDIFTSQRNIIFLCNSSPFFTYITDGLLKFASTIAYQAAQHLTAVISLKMSKKSSISSFKSIIEGDYELMTSKRTGEVNKIIERGA
ncbi:MAG: hypothetical protein MHPSP_002851, partial [Paramarteilia canceri]